MIWPRHLQTIENMRAAGVPVYAKCTGCGLRLRASYDLLAKLHGPDASLINRRGRCPNLDCDGGRYLYLAKPGKGLPYRPLTDR